MGEPIETVKRADEGRPTVAFRTTCLRQKAEWERAVKESERYASLSQLIRLAVNRQIAGDFEGEKSRSEPPDLEAVEQIQESIERVESRLGNIGQSVERLENQTYAEGGLSEDTIQAVFAELPIGEGEAMSSRENYLPSDIAERTELEETTVKMALEQLRNDMASVKRVEQPDGTHWFREA